MTFWSQWRFSIQKSQNWRKLNPRISELKMRPGSRDLGSRYCNPYATDQLADASVSRVSALVSARKASRTSL